MKKIKTLLLTSLTAIMLCFCFLFAACGGGVAGTYKFDSMEVGGVTYEAGDTFEIPYLGSQELSENYLVVTLNDDNTATYAVFEQEALICTWAEEDGKIVLTSDGVKVAAFEKSGSSLIAEEAGTKLVLKK